MMSCGTPCNRFTVEYERSYADSAEEAMRKNLFVQTERFVASGNRLGASFAMGRNFLADRLDAELQALLGVTLDDEHFAAEDFPHARHQLRDLEDQLPTEFDWRERGGVTPVRCKWLPNTARFSQTMLKWTYPELLHILISGRVQCSYITFHIQVG